MFDTIHRHTHNSTTHYNIELGGVERELKNIAKSLSIKGVLENEVTRKALLAQYKNMIASSQKIDELRNQIWENKVPCVLPKDCIKNCQTCYWGRFPIPYTQYNTEHLYEFCSFPYIGEEEKSYHLTTTISNMFDSNKCCRWQDKQSSQNIRFEIKKLEQKIDDMPKVFDISREEFIKIGKMLMLSEEGVDDDEFRVHA